MATFPKGIGASMKLALNVNGKPASIVADDPEMPLLYALRDDLGLHGPLFGCGLGQCGSCTVLVDGKAVRSCSMPVSSAVGRKVVTLEGLGTPAKPHPLQQAFIADQAAQCGYCTSGMLISALALLERTPRPSEAEVKQALDRNLCRCGSYNRIVRAVLRVAGGSAT